MVVIADRRQRARLESLWCGALNSVNIPLGLEAGLAIVIVCIILDRMSRVRAEPHDDGRRRDSAMSTSCPAKDTARARHDR